MYNYNYECECIFNNTYIDCISFNHWFLQVIHHISYIDDMWDANHNITPSDKNYQDFINRIKTKCKEYFDAGKINNLEKYYNIVDNISSAYISLSNIKKED